MTGWVLDVAALLALVLAFTFSKYDGSLADLGCGLAAGMFVLLIRWDRD